MVRVSYLSTEFGSGLGELKVSLQNEKCVEWHRYNYVYRTFTIDHKVKSANFAKFSQSSDPNELWAVIVSEEQMVYCYGLVTGTTHVMGLTFRPIGVFPFGNQGVVFAYRSKKKTHINLIVLEAPEVLSRVIVPSSVCSPLNTDDFIQIIDEKFMVVWNETLKKVRVYSIKTVPYEKLPSRLHNGLGTSTTRPSSGFSGTSGTKNTKLKRSLVDMQQEFTNAVMETVAVGVHGKAAVFSPLSEWSQSSIGKSFSQVIDSSTGIKAELVACLDPESKRLYALCGSNLVEYDGIEHVTPVKGVFGYPGAVLIDQNGDKVLSFLFSPNSDQLPLNFATSGEEKILSINSEPYKNWVEITTSERKRRIELILSIDTSIKPIFNILRDLFTPFETLNCVLMYFKELLVPKERQKGKFRVPNSWRSLSSVLKVLLNSIPSQSASQLIVYLHLLREELSILAGSQTYYRYLTSFIAPFVMHWGDEWVAAYTLNPKRKSKTSTTEVPDPLNSTNPEALPRILDHPPHLYSSLIKFIDISLGSPDYDSFIKHHLFPNSGIIYGFFYVCTTSNSEIIAEFIRKYQIKDKLDLFMPAIRTCLLEVCSKIDAEEPRETERVEYHRSSDLTKALFPNDLRYKECQRLLQVNETQKCSLELYRQLQASDETTVPPQWSEHLAIRALDSAFGKAAVEIASYQPMIWEQMEPIGITFEGECTESGLSISPAYKTLEAAASANPWGVFAHGVAQGLSVSPNSSGIDSIWVISSAKLNEASSELYSGFVYGMGLCGHLASLEDWQFYESLVSADTCGTQAALLGVSASKCGSCDSKLTKVLSVHIRALLPEGAYNTQLVSPEVEQAALISLGLLYYKQGVAHLTKILLKELCSVTQPVKQLNSSSIFDGEGTEELQGHKLAVGITLGLIQCCKGKESGLDTLVSCVSNFNDRSVDLAEIENGVLCALLLAYTGSNQLEIASKIMLPTTKFSVSYCSPSIIFGRALTHNMIMWDSVRPTQDWIQSQIPNVLKLSDKLDPHDDQVNVIYQYSALVGVLVSLAMRYCGSGSNEVVDLLLPYAERLKEDYKLMGKWSKMSANRPSYEYMRAGHAIAELLGCISLALAAVAAGTGNLKVLRLLRELYQIAPQFQLFVCEEQLASEFNISYHYISQAIGWLFLGDGTMSFKTDKESISVLTCFTFLPFIGSTNVDHGKWRHLNFFWALVTEKRCLYIHGSPEKKVRVDVYTTSNRVLEKTTPFLLPPLDQVSHIKVVDDYYLTKEVKNEELNRAIISGLKLVTQKTASGTLQAQLEQNKRQQELSWDDLEVDMLKAVLETMAKRPKLPTQMWDVSLLLVFYKFWPTTDKLRYLKKRDVEKLRFLQWRHLQNLDGKKEDDEDEDDES